MATGKACITHSTAGKLRPDYFGEKKQARKKGPRSGGIPKKKGTPSSIVQVSHFVLPDVSRRKARTVMNQQKLGAGGTVPGRADKCYTASKFKSLPYLMGLDIVRREECYPSHARVVGAHENRLANTMSRGTIGGPRRVVTDRTNRRTAQRRVSVA